MKMIDDHEKFLRAVKERADAGDFVVLTNAIYKPEPGRGVEDLALLKERFFKFLEGRFNPKKICLVALINSDESTAAWLRMKGAPEEAIQAMPPFAERLPVLSQGLRPDLVTVMDDPTPDASYKKLAGVTVPGHRALVKIGGEYTPQGQGIDKAIIGKDSIGPDETFAVKEVNGQLFLYTANGQFVLNADGKPVPVAVAKHLRGGPQNG